MYARKLMTKATTEITQAETAAHMVRSAARTARLCSSDCSSASSLSFRVGRSRLKKTFESVVRARDAFDSAARCSSSSVARRRKNSGISTSSLSLTASLLQVELPLQLPNDPRGVCRGRSRCARSSSSRPPRRRSRPHRRGQLDRHKARRDDFERLAQRCRRRQRSRSPLRRLERQDLRALP